MRCLSCQLECASSEAKVVLGVFLCSSCGTLAEKAEKEIEQESARALQLAKSTMAQHILRGGLLRTAKEPA